MMDMDIDAFVQIDAVVLAQLELLSATSVRTNIWAARKPRPVFGPTDMGPNALHNYVPAQIIERPIGIS
mgnify:CR=1 FL=1|jgi:hypothetical protein